jgi:hypothetical protein
MHVHETCLLVAILVLTGSRLFAADSTKYTPRVFPRM